MGAQDALEISGKMAISKRIGRDNSDPFRGFQDFTSLQVFFF